MNPILRALRASWIPLLAILVLGSIPFLEFLFTNKMLYGSDQIGGFGNFVQYQKSLRAFSIPGWHPWYLSGMPTLDAIAGDLPYPIFWVVAFLFPVHKILGLMMWSHVILAGFGAYLLLRRCFDLERWSATALATAYMLNMNILSIINGGHTAKVYIQAWLPFGFYFLIRTLGPKARFWHPLGLSVTVALMVSTSHLQMTYYALIAYGVYLLWRLWEIIRGSEALASRVGLVVRKSAAFGMAILLGVGLALPVLYPPLKYVKSFSIRNTSEKTSFEHATSWSLHPEEIGSLAFPEFSGMNETYWGRNSFKLNSEYAGIAITILGLAAAFCLRTRQTWFWGTIALLSLLNGLGAHTPFYKLIFDLNVPGIRNFRAASMVMFLWAASLLALTAIWVRTLDLAETWTATRRDHWTKRLWIAAGAVGAVFLVAALAPEFVHDSWMSLFADPQWAAQNQQNWPADISAFRIGALRAAFLGGGVLVLSALRVAGTLPGPGFSMGILLVTLLDLLPLAPNFVKTFRHDDYYSPEPLLQSLQLDSSTFRVADMPGSLTSGSLMLYNLETAGGFADNEMAHMQEFRGRDWQRTLAGLVQSQDGTIQGSRILDLLNVKYLLYKTSEAAPLGAALNRSILPRARLVDHVVAMPLAGQLNGVLDSSFAYRTSILLDPSEIAKAPIAAGLVGRPADSTPVGDVRWERFGSDRWVYQVTAARASVLVLAEPWYPFWVVKIDGKESPLLRADYALRAIAVPAGNHRVEMEFHSQWGETARRGMFASAGALALWLGLWAVWSRRKNSTAV